MNQKTKVLVVVQPYLGHLIPMCCLVKELSKNKNLHVTIFSIEKYKDLIEKSGAEYKQYSNFPNIDTNNLNLLRLYLLVTETGNVQFEILRILILSSNIYNVT
jgi:UDP:flavonoid glycosyltransferase YjiC (YdhE family)